MRHGSLHSVVLLFLAALAGAAAGAIAQEPTAPATSAAAPRASADDKKPPRPGIPVDDALVHAHCARCHALDERQHMTRISYVRKSPEGWSETIKRMGRLHGLQLSADDAKQLVRSLANSHGLARSEAERGLYESERRVHWSEAHHDQDFQRACAQCHPLGRVLLQQRDAEEWQLLRATHVAMFPLSRGQMGGGPPDDEERRPGGSRGGENSGAAAPAGAAGSATSGRTRGRGDGDAPAAPTASVGDRVLQKLAADQPLFTPAWEAWSTNRREVPLAGFWTVCGHEIGRGDIIGTAEIRRIAAEDFEVVWNLRFPDGASERVGKGVLYAGYSWRGRSQEPAAGSPSWREVLLLDDAWQTLKGRLFTGDHDEIGADVTLHRDLGRPRVLAVGNGAIEVPASGHRLDAYGEAFPDDLAPRDFFVGSGLTVTAVERRSPRHVVLTVDAAAGTALGPRTVAFRLQAGGAQVVLYDTVDYVRIRPLQGLARIGGIKHPKQFERFEAIAVHRGKDEKPYTADDVDLFPVRPRWGLDEFKVRDDDDDLTYVGSIDPETGVFTPNVDGPNLLRKWQANNVGDVFVTAAVELDVPVRPAAPAPGNDAPPPPARERRRFFARARLLVTVPLYVKWHALDWEDR
jgi:quinohemoprotein amine dehydrogenase